MADIYPNEMPAPTRPVVKRAGAAMGRGAIRQIVSFTLNGQLIGDKLLLPKLPKGGRGVRYRIQSSVGLGASTLALGITGNTGKYRAAATLNVTTAEDVSSAVNTAAILTADEDPFLTIAAANLPVGGTLTVEAHYTL